MINFPQAQQDIYHALLSAPDLQNINGMYFRKMIILSEVNMKLIYLNARNGKSGCGWCVLMPEIRVPTGQNVQGPPVEITFPILVMEQPQVNLNASTGTLTHAEQVAISIIQALHLLSLGVGSLTASQDAIVPQTQYQGVVAYRVNCKFNNASRTPTPRTGQVNIISAGGNVTITCSGDPSAQIYYTTDGSYPANNTGGNPQSKSYTVPFPTPAAGTLIRAAAYMTGKLIGSITPLQL